jgi:diguanylate cyclase (GGDEF)-like protein
MKKLLANNKNLLIYLLFFFIMFCLITYIYLYDIRTDTRQQNSAYSITEWDDYTAIESMSKTIINGSIPIDPSVGNILAFYSIHQSVEVYVDNVLLYQYPIENNNPFSKSPGYCWNFIELPNMFNNVQIIIKSPYSKYLAEVPTFYIGNELSLPSHIISSNIASFMICIAIFICGLVLIVYHYVLARTASTNDKLLKLGLFALLLALWSINECHMTVLLLRNNLSTSYVSFLALMLLPYPFAKFVQTFYEDNRPIWNLFYKVDLFQIAFCLVMMACGLYDLRQTLWTTHVMLLFVICIIVIESIRLLQDSQLSHNVIIHLICIVICLGSLVLDLIGYYMGCHDNSRFARVGFFLYILILGMSSMRESLSLMKKGQEASAFQKLAYTDQMTGLNNRTCFNKDFEIMSHNPTDIAVIDFDLNNLKKTNDTYGHSAGDKYIITCATIINEIFCGIGKCYRVGGDEFVALIEKSSTIDMTYYLAMLESSVDNANKNVDKFKMAIAYGYTVYDPETDKNLEDTYNRADKIMYKNKEDKKTIHRR